MKTDSLLNSVGQLNSGGPAQMSKRKRVDADLPTPGPGGAPPKKRTKGKKAAGKLAGLMLLPMDVLFEVFSHLYPLDILNLARTTKEFRTILLHKSSSFAWKAARDNIPDLPTTFPEMSEPRFINLMFSTHCHVCLTPNIRSVEWLFRVRLCVRCAKTSLIIQSVPTELRGAVVVQEVGRHLCTVIFSPELEESKARLDEISNEEDKKAYIKKRKAWVEAVTLHAATCKAWFRSSQQDRANELNLLRDEREKAIIWYLEDLGWGSEIQQIQHEDRISNRKVARLPIRLTPRIWRNIKPEMVAHMEAVKAKRLARERHSLIASRMLFAINYMRSFKLQLTPWPDIWPQASDFCEFPAVRAILEMPSEFHVNEHSFKELTTALHKMLSLWRFKLHDKILARFSPILKEGLHLRQISSFGFNDFSLSRLPESLTYEQTSEEVEDLARWLTLATTVFKCPQCSANTNNLYRSYGDEDGPTMSTPPLQLSSDPDTSLFYPSVAAHHCLNRRTTLGLRCVETCRRLEAEDPMVYLRCSYEYRSQWSCNQLQIDADASKKMQSIVVACGLDPLTATPHDLDCCDAWLGCPACPRWPESDDIAQIQTFQWKAALRHQSLRHFREDIFWFKLTEEEIESTQALHEAWGPLQDLADTTIPTLLEKTKWSCVHCLDRPTEVKPQFLLPLKTHISLSHGIAEPRLYYDYFQGLSESVRATNCQNSVIYIAMNNPAASALDYVTADD